VELRVSRLFFDLRFVAAKVVADLRDCGEFGKAKFAFSWEALAASLCAPNSPLCAAHIGTGARVDLDGFAFLDEQRNVDRLARLKLCRFGNVAGGVTAKPFW
jgi:hypothetical protein